MHQAFGAAIAAARLLRLGEARLSRRFRARGNDVRGPRRPQMELDEPAALLSQGRRRSQAENGVKAACRGRFRLAWQPRYSGR